MWVRLVLLVHFVVLGETVTQQTGNSWQSDQKDGIDGKKTKSNEQSINTNLIDHRYVGNSFSSNNPFEEMIVMDNKSGHDYHRKLWELDPSGQSNTQPTQQSSSEPDKTVSVKSVVDNDTNSIFIAGELQSSLKGTDGDKTFQQNDNNSIDNFRSSFRHDDYQSVVQQSFALIANDKTRHLATTEASYYISLDFMIVYFVLQCVNFLWRPMITYE